MIGNNLLLIRDEIFSNWQFLIIIVIIRILTKSLSVCASVLLTCIGLDWIEFESVKSLKIFSQQAIAQATSPSTHTHTERQPVLAFSVVIVCCCFCCCKQSDFRKLF